VKITIKQMAEKLGVEVDVARGLVRFLEVSGAVTKLDETVPPAGGKGKGQNVYDLDENALVSQVVKIVTKIVE
jgi:predicted ArsR family transcriptional regulator